MNHLFQNNLAYLNQLCYKNFEKFISYNLNPSGILDKLVKSRFLMAKKKVPNSRRANPE